jgi:hypothetical protein
LSHVLAIWAHLVPPAAEIVTIAAPSPAANFIRIRLHFRSSRLIHLMAVTTAKGERKMNEIPAETPNAEQSAPAEPPQAAKKARVGAHRPHVPPSKAKSPMKATTPAKKAQKGPKSAKSPKKTPSVRQGSKAAKVLGLLKRSGGASLKELTKATGWQKHSVRGFLSGALGTKMGLTVTSIKAEGEERRYSIKA